MRSGSDERHITSEDIEELREFIEGESLEDFSDIHSPWIISDLVERSVPSIVGFFEMLFILECTIFIFLHAIGILDTIFPVHIAELVEKEFFSSESYTAVFEEYWS